MSNILKFPDAQFEFVAVPLMLLPPMMFHWSDGTVSECPTTLDVAVLIITDFKTGRQWARRM